MSKKYYFVNSINEEDNSFEVREVGSEVVEKIYADQKMFEDTKLMLADSESENEPLIIELDLGRE